MWAMIPAVPPCDPVTPNHLFIPYKDRLARLSRTFDDDGITQAQSEQLNNFKTIERWALDWMALAASPSRCDLFLPYKDHSRLPQDISAAQSFENWKVIERWAHDIATGVCGCNCVPHADPPLDRCRLFVPHKDHLLGVDLLDPAQLAQAAQFEFDNFKELERWANRYSDGTCGCTMPE